MRTTSTPKLSDDYPYFENIWDRTSGENIDKALAMLIDFSQNNREKFRSSFWYAKDSTNKDVKEIISSYTKEVNGYLNYPNTLACNIGFLLYQLARKRLIYLQNSLPIIAILEVIEKKTGIDPKPFIEEASNPYPYSHPYDKDPCSQQYFILNNITKHNNWLDMMFQSMNYAFPYTNFLAQPRATGFVPSLKLSGLVTDDELLDYFVAHPHEDDPSLYALKSLDQKIKFDRKKLEDLYESALSNNQYTLAYYLCSKAHKWRIAHGYTIKNEIHLLDRLIDNARHSYIDAISMYFYHLEKTRIASFFILKLIEHIKSRQSSELSPASVLIKLFYNMEHINEWEKVEKKFQECFNIDFYDVLVDILPRSTPAQYLLDNKRLESIPSSKLELKNPESENYTKISLVQYVILACKNKSIPEPKALSACIEVLAQHDSQCIYSLDSDGRNAAWYFNQFKTTAIAASKDLAIPVCRDLITAATQLDIEINFNDILGRLIKDNFYKTLKYLLKNKRISLSGTLFYLNEKTGEHHHCTPLQYAILVFMDVSPDETPESALLKIVQLFCQYDPDCINVLDSMGRNAGWYFDLFVKTIINERLTLATRLNNYHHGKLQEISHLLKVKINLNEFFERLIEHRESLCMIRHLITNDSLNLTTLSLPQTLGVTPLQYIILALKENNDMFMFYQLEGVIKHAKQNHPACLESVDSDGRNSIWYLKELANDRLDKYPDRIVGLFESMNRISTILCLGNDYLDITQFTGPFWFNKQTKKYGCKNTEPGSINITALQYIILALKKSEASERQLKEIIAHVKECYPASLDLKDGAGNDLAWYLQDYVQDRTLNFSERMKYLSEHMKSISEMIGITINVNECLFNQDLNLFTTDSKRKNSPANFQVQQRRYF